MLTPEEQVGKIKNSWIVFAQPQRRVFSVSGRDTLRYLQGRITQDIKNLSTREQRQSLILTPQGKIQGKFHIVRREEDFLLLSDPLANETDIAEFCAALLQFKVADDVRIEQLSDYSVFSLQGPESEQLLRLAGFAPSFTTTATSLGASYLLQEHFGFLLLLAPTESDALLPRLSEHFGDALGDSLLHISLGSPQFGSELSEKILAPEIPLSKLASFSKGCYAGQEVVEMATARGRPNRQLVILEGKASGAFATNSEVRQAGAVCGFVTRSVFLPTSGVAKALAFVKANVAMDTAFFLDESEFHITPALSL